MSDNPPPPATLAPAASPLEEADPNSINQLIAERINDLFNKKPLMLSDDDLKIMVEYYRRERARFIIESQAKPPRAVAKAAAARKAAPTSVADAISSMQTNEDLL